MECLTGAVDGICFIRWNEQPTARDVRGVAEGILHARRATGRPLVVLAVLPPRMRLPGAEARAELVRLTPIVERASEAHLVVLGGEGVAGALLRGMTLTIAAIMRAPLDIYSSIPAAVERACARLGLDAETVTRAAIDRKLLNPF